LAKSAAKIDGAMMSCCGMFSSAMVFA